MGKKIRFYLLAAALMLTLPGTVLLPPAYSGEKQSAASAGSAEHAANIGGTYRVLRKKTGEIEEIPVREYLIGALAAEMPVSFANEALKAQVVASHTYAERIRMQNSTFPKESLCGADFSDDSAEYQAYFSEAQRRQAYGTRYAAYEAKIEAAVDAAGGLLLCQEEKPIIAAFHASSAGKTESAKDIFGMELSYLTAVDSEGDRHSPYYGQEVVLPAETVRKSLCAALPETKLQENPADWIAVTEQSTSGSVLRAKAGTAQTDGQTLRAALGLKSACFSAAYDAENECFRFTVSGSGHGVGMSQYGANAMAGQGDDFRTILAHYYPGAVLLDISEPMQYNMGTLS